jgi:hypothetical protein
MLCIENARVGCQDNRFGQYTMAMMMRGLLLLEARAKTYVVNFRRPDVLVHERGGAAREKSRRLVNRANNLQEFNQEGMGISSKQPTENQQRSITQCQTSCNKANKGTNMSLA